MSQINIEHSFEYAGGAIEVILHQNTAFVSYSDGNEFITLEDSSGDIADWSDLYQGKWLFLSGAALKSAEIKFAKEYGINALAEYIVFTNQYICEREDELIALASNS